MSAKAAVISAVLNKCGCMLLCDHCAKMVADIVEAVKPVPIPMRLHCPGCLTLHIDEGEFATKPHTSHACQNCGLVWRPAVCDTVGVRFLPGFKNEVEP